ncbi:MAG: Hsp33 family molecular chaperone HslO [Candidatus Gallimonas sp.]
MQKEMSAIYKTLIYDREVSLAVLDTTSLVNEAIARHGLTPVTAAALGRTLTVSAYLCSWLKSDTSALSVTVNGGGAGGKICVSGDGRLFMRGFIERPDADLPPRADGKLDVGSCVGRSGTISVIREDEGAAPFVGTCELVSGEIGEDFSAYFYVSEQRPTAIAVGVKISPDGRCLGAGGVMLQPLPGASEESLVRAESAIGAFSAISTLVAEKGAEGILREYFSVADAERREIFYRCHCSREKIARLILTMGRAEAEAIVRDEGSVRVHCHYCNTDYTFDETDVAKLFARSEEVT